MKNIFLLFLLVLAQNAFSQNIEWLTDREYEFGYIPQGQPVTTSFQFKNTSSDSISIELVRTTCGCTAPTWTMTPIAPDSIGTIELEYDAYKLGSFDKKARVFISGARRGIRLDISGEVE